VRVCGWACEGKPEFPVGKSRLPSSDGVAVSPVDPVFPEFADTESFDDEDDDVDAVAVWSPAAMNPARRPPTATLIPAAMTRPCMLNARRAMP
jgi:hypothetical protein